MSALLRHQRPRRLLLGFEGDARRRQRHQRQIRHRRATRQDIVLTTAARRSRARGARPACSLRQAADGPRPPLRTEVRRLDASEAESDADEDVSRAHAEHRAYRDVGRGRKRAEHRRGGFARGDDVDGIGASKRLRDVAVQARDGPDLRRSRPIWLRRGWCGDACRREGTDGQFTCRGSAQAERPATRSNCRRTWLTT